MKLVARTRRPDAHAVVRAIDLEIFVEEVSVELEVVEVMVRGLLEGVSEVDVFGGTGRPLQQAVGEGRLARPGEACDQDERGGGHGRRGVGHRSEGRGVGVRLRDDGFLSALGKGQLVFELGLAVPFAVRDGFHADETGLAEGRLAVGHELGGGRVEAQLFGELAGKLADEHGQRLAPLREPQRSQPGP